MKLKSFFLFIILLLSAVFVYSQEVAPGAVNPQDTPRDAAHTRGYTIGPGDQVAGTIHGEMGYDFVVNVDEDGMIMIPFVKKPMVAQCKTERELKAEIELEIKKYLRDPSFALRVSEKHSRPPVSVSGEVVQPAEITLTRRITLIEVLALAKGLKEEASGQIQVSRPKTPICMAENDPDNWKGDSSLRTYSYASIQLGKEDSNPTIYPGDVIKVMKVPPVYITGQVVGGQGVYLKENGLSLTEAIGMVGGPRPEANIKNIAIYRLKPASNPDSKDRDLISANYELIRKGQQKDVMMRPYDIVVVDKAKKPIGVTIAEFALAAGKSAASAFTTAVPYSIIY